MTRPSKSVALLKVLIVAAHADSTISQSELNYIKDLARQFNLNDDEWFELQPYIEDPIPLSEQDAIVTDLLSCLGTAGERNTAIQHLTKIVEVDGSISCDEKDLLNHYKNILMEASSSELVFRKLRNLFQKKEPASKLDIDEFLRNKILFKLRRRIGSEHITPEIHRLALLGGLMGIVSQADGTIDERELNKICETLTAESSFDEAGIALLVEIIAEESVRGLDRHRVIAEYSADLGLSGRIDLLDLLFTVAGSDGEISHQELEELRSISSALNLNHKQYIEAKLRAKRG